MTFLFVITSVPTLSNKRIYILLMKNGSYSVLYLYNIYKDKRRKITKIDKTVITSCYNWYSTPQLLWVVR